jgi:hypothetical protein
LKWRNFGVTETGTTPLPAKPITCGEPVALSVIVNVPL